MFNIFIPKIQTLITICYLIFEQDFFYQLTLSLLLFANSLDPDQDRQNVKCPDLIVFLKEFFEKVGFEKKSAVDKKSMKNYPACKN